MTTGFARWTKEQYEARNKRMREEWPHGTYGKRARNQLLALLEITGKPSTAKKMMDELELWRDERRPPPHLLQEWIDGWMAGKFASSPAILAAIQKQYDAHRRGDMDETLREANSAHRSISGAIKEKQFDKDYSGALQHLGQIITIGTEKREQTFNPRSKQNNDQQIIAFNLVAPPERRQLTEQVIEGEARQIG